MPNLSYRSITPHTRTNDYILPVSKNQQDMLNAHYHIFNFKSWQDPALSPKDSLFFDSSDFFSRALVYVISETVGDYPYPYLTEKTWKAILHQRPFMIVGAKNSLAQLKEFGFRTFDRWWNESYDSAESISDRISGVVSELIKLHQLTVEEWSALEEAMRPVLEYNADHLKTFTQQDLSNIKKQLQIVDI